MIEKKAAARYASHFEGNSNGVISPVEEEEEEENTGSGAAEDGGRRKRSPFTS